MIPRGIGPETLRGNSCVGCGAWRGEGGGGKVEISLLSSFPFSMPTSGEEKGKFYSIVPPHSRPSLLIFCADPLIPAVVFAGLERADNSGKSGENLSVFSTQMLKILANIKVRGI